MRTRHLVVFAAVLAAASVNAQITQWGPRIGLNLSTLSSAGLVSGLDGWKFGGQGGLAWDIDYQNSFHFSPELLWITKGSATRNTSQYTRTYSTYRYLEADLLGKFDLTGDNDDLFMTLGPTLGYLMSARTRTLYDGTETADVKVQGKDFDRRLDIGGAVGIGYELGAWLLEFRAQVGFSAIGNYSTAHNVTLGVHFTRYFAWGKSADEEETP